MPTVAIIDYDSGNLHSAAKGLETAGARVLISRDPQQILRADGVVLPGVGAFDQAIAQLRQYDLEPVINQAIAQQQPFLGICVGMQLLFDSSAEGNLPGLGIIPGKVVKIQPEPHLTIPHMGWNQLQVAQPDCSLWQQLDPNPWFYFVHSYFGLPQDSSWIAASTTHGTQTLTAAIARANLFAVQFHPEKSSRSGLQMLRNFIKLLA
ncbi:MAG: imidazole glycerol phosphate synthase subunit HisH [Pseudanabaenaceae cyanobacterium bins.68]|nr:imidazole glycerol phosphate synthase subunit HisH [Pseudanabaenaceae cyanobacterium bins.68]